MSDSPSVLAAFYGFQSSQIAVMTIVGLYFLVDLWGFIDYLCSKPQRSKQKKQDQEAAFRLRISLFLSGCSAVFSMALLVPIAFLVDVSFPVCQFLTKTNAMTYVMAVMCAFVFLLQKAKLVARFEVNNTFYQKVFRLAEAGIVLFIPACMALCGWLIDGKLTQNDHRCLLVSPAWFSWIFGVGIVFLSGLLMYLFLHPVFEISKAELSTADTDKFKSVYHTNAIAGTLTVISTFTAVGNYAILHQFADDAGNALDGNYAISVTVMAWDVVVLTVCTRATTFVWLPRVLQRRFARDSSAAVVQSLTNSPNKSSKSSKHVAVPIGTAMVSHDSSANMVEGGVSVNMVEGGVSSSGGGQ